MVAVFLCEHAWGIFHQTAPFPIEGAYKRIKKQCATPFIKGDHIMAMQKNTSTFSFLSILCYFSLKD